MDFDYDVEEQKQKARTRYNFDLIRPGASLHVADHQERCRVLAAFRYWAQQKPERATAYATSAQVGEEDPKGPGFRIWFKSKRQDARKMLEKVDQVSTGRAGGSDAATDI